MNLPFYLGNSSKDLAMDLYVGVFVDFPQACIILKRHHHFANLTLLSSEHLRFFLANTVVSQFQQMVWGLTPHLPLHMPMCHPSIASIPGRLGNLLQGRSISSSSVAFHGVPEKAVDGQWGDNTFCEYCAQNDPLHVCASTRRQEIAELDLRFWGCGWWLMDVEFDSIWDEKCWEFFRGYGCKKSGLAELL